MSYLGHALVENRTGLIAAAMVMHADSYAERDAALLMLAEKRQGRSRRVLKQTGPLRQVKLRGVEKVDRLFDFSRAAHNQIGPPRLMAQPPRVLREQRVESR